MTAPVAFLRLPRPPSWSRVFALVTLFVLLSQLSSGLTAASAAGATWVWPVAGERSILASYLAPATPYSPGHRGIDIASIAGAEVMAPTEAVVSFAGVIAGRGILTLRTGDLQISFEAVSTMVAEGDQVTSGQVIAHVGSGTHCECLHVGVRRAGDYLSPMAFFSAIAPARLQPWDDNRWARAEPGVTYPH